MVRDRQGLLMILQTKPWISTGSGDLAVAGALRDMKLTLRLPGPADSDVERCGFV